MILVTSDFPPAFGGIQRYAVRLAQEIARTGQETIVITPTCARDDFDDGVFNFRVIRSPGRTRAGRALGLFVTYLAVLRRARASYTIATLWTTAVPLALLPRFLRGPLAILVHGSEVAPSRRGLRGFLSRLAFFAADHVIANSDFTYGLLRQAGITRPVTVVPCGVDPRVEQRRPAARPTILSVGRLVPRKGFDAVIETLPQLRSLHPNLVYEIVGDGPQRAELEALAARLGVAKHVRFLGALDDAAIFEAFDRATCFAMPCRRVGDDVEGFGIVFLEAAVAGIPSVGGTGSGAPEAIGDCGGLLVDGNDTSAIADALQRLLDDPIRARAMGAAARERALRSFAWERTAREIRAICEDERRDSAPAEFRSVRVLHVLEATLGGTRRYLEDILDANVHAEMGLAYSIERADVQFPALLERARSAGWATFEIPMIRRISPRDDVMCSRALRGVISRYSPDVVHAHSSKAGALARLVVPTMRRRPAVVYSPHAIASDLGLAYRAIEKLLALVTTRFVAVSKDEREQLFRLGLAPRSRIDVASPVIDGVRFAPRDPIAAKNRLGLEGTVVLLGIGRLSEQKDPLGFFDVALAVRRRFSRVRAVWVGDGELRAALEARIRGRDAGNWFAITGWQDDVRDYIAAADILLSTSRYESFGYGTAEALAMERAVVASDVPGTREIMADELKGLTYPLGDIQAAVTRCASIIESPSLAANLARLGRTSVVERFSTDSLRRSLATSYRNALNDRQLTKTPAARDSR